MLVRGRRCAIAALHSERGSDVCLGNFLKMVNFVRFEHDLQIFKTASVVEFNKTKRFGVANGFDPSAYCDFILCIPLRFGIQLYDFNSLHIALSLLYVMAGDSQKIAHEMMGGLRLAQRLCFLTAPVNL